MKIWIYIKDKFYLYRTILFGTRLWLGEITSILFHLELKYLFRNRSTAENKVCTEIPVSLYRYNVMSFNYPIRRICPQILF